MTNQQVGTAGNGVFVRALDFGDVLKGLCQLLQGNLGGVGVDVFAHNPVAQTQHHQVFGGVEVGAQHTGGHGGEGDDPVTVLDGDNAVVILGGDGSAGQAGQGEQQRQDETGEFFDVHNGFPFKKSVSC